MAQARGLSVGLHWTRGPGAEACIGPIELARRIETRLGRAVFDPAGTAELALEGRIERTAEGAFQARLAVVDERGEELGSRELAGPGPDCRALDEALTLVIAVTLYPEGGLDGLGIALPNDVSTLLGEALTQLEQQAPAATPARSESASKAEPPEPPKEPPATSASGAPPRAWQVRVAGAGLVRVGATPAPTLGAQLGIEIVPPAWPLFELGAAVLTGGGSEFSVGGSRGSLRASASRLGLALCPEALDGALELRGCLGGEVLLLAAESSGLLRDDQQRLIVPAVTLGARAALWLAPSLALRAGLGLVAPVVRPDLRVQARSGEELSVFAQPAVGAEATFGLVWRTGP